MNVLRLLAGFLVCVACAPRVHAAPLVLDFEDLDDLEAVGSHYAGMTFSNAIALTAGISLNEFDFPPRSGGKVISDDGGAMQISFGAAVGEFGGFFTYTTPLTVTAFDADHHVIATASSQFASNLALDPGSSPNEFISVAAASGIWALTISGLDIGASFVFDDARLTPLETNVVPEPGTLSLLFLGGVIARRHVRAQRLARTD